MNLSNLILNQFIPFFTQLCASTIAAVAQSLSHNWIPLSLAVITAVLLKVYVNTEKLSKLLVNRTKVSILASVAVGAFTPFCACGTTAVILGMLTTTLPWGPVMAFLTSSPLMSPDGFIMIAGVISMRFAIALTVASIVIGLVSGFLTHFIERKTHYLDNQSRFLGNAKGEACSCSAPVKAEVSGCSCGAAAINTGVTKGKTGSFSKFLDKIRWHELWDTFVNLGLKQILFFFILFVAIGYLINYFIPSSIISVLFGAKNIFAVPLASLIGLPLYITTESGIPIIKSILASGASEGAMLAFMITGSATSAWVIAGISSFMKKKAVALYIAFVLAGGILFGYLYDFILLFLK